MIRVHTHRTMAIGAIAALMLAASLLFFFATIREKKVQADARALFATGFGEQCFESPTTPQTAQEAVYFVGCGGFF